MSYDNACKFLVEQYPVDFVRWLLATEVEDIQLLKTELSQEPIRADALTFLKAANQVLHLEFQTLPASNPPLPFRMLDYSVRLKRQYGNNVVQVVLFLKETTSDAAFTDRYEDQTTLHHYRVIRLWEQAPAIFLENPALLPLATLAQTDSPTSLLREVAERVARIADRQQRGNLASCTEIFAGLRFPKDLIKGLFREDIMRESVIYQDILQQGVQQGLQQGLQQEAISMVMRQLTRRLGEIEPTLQERIRGLSLVQLETLAEDLLDFSQMGDLVAWLERPREMPPLE
jgi:predicted transposase/invertase (TIGR01784 family)